MRTAKRLQSVGCLGNNHSMVLQQANCPDETAECNPVNNAHDLAHLDSFCIKLADKSSAGLALPLRDAKNRPKRKFDYFIPISKTQQKLNF